MAKEVKIPPLNFVLECVIELTERCAKVLVCVQGLVASLVVNVPHANRFVIAGRNNVFATRMEYDATHPVIVTVQCKQANADAYIPNLIYRNS